MHSSLKINIIVQMSSGFPFIPFHFVFLFCFSFFFPSRTSSCRGSLASLKLISSVSPTRASSLLLPTETLSGHLLGPCHSDGGEAFFAYFHFGCNHMELREGDHYWSRDGLPLSWFQPDSKVSGPCG